MKKIFKSSIKILFASLIAVQLSSCTDYLNVSDQLASEMTMNDVFNNVGYTKRFHGFIYNGTADMTFICIDPSYRNMTGMDNPWGALTDEFKAGQGNPRNIPSQGYNAGNAQFSRWHLYSYIRQAHQFIKYAKVIPRTGETEYLDEAELKQMKAEARFFVAYYHWKLFELYGPIPLMKEEVDPSAADLDFGRNTMDECIEYLDKELKEVAEQLSTSEPENRAGVPTKGVALAVRTQMWVFAASKLYNGGWPAAMALQNPDGKKLFPAADAGKWQKAKAAFEDFYAFAKGPYGYALHREYPLWNGGNFSPEESLYQATKKANKEIIWAISKNSWGQLGGEGTWSRLTPRPLATGMPSYGVQQALVDDFFMANGKKIDEAGSGYTTDGFVDYEFEMWNRNTDPLRTKTTKVVSKISNRFVGREPRFYLAVFFQGRPWQIENRIALFHKNANTDSRFSNPVLFDNSSDNQPWTGYSYWKKYDQAMYPTGTSPRTPTPALTPNIQIRYADLLLIGAEILNEATNGADPRIYQFIDDVRSRAGIPMLKDIKPGMNKEQIAKAIRDERRIELLGEGQRYFDVRRWMIHREKGSDQSAPMYGLDMQSTDPYEGYHKVVKTEDKVWYSDDRMLLYPIPLNEVQKSKKLVQNPGW